MILPSVKKLVETANDSEGNNERPARLGVQFRGWHWAQRVTPMQKLDKSTKIYTILVTVIIKINTKSNIIIVWANIKCQRPSTLWADTFNDKFDPFISHHKICRMYFYMWCPVCFFMQNGFNLVNRWLVSIYMSLFLCLFHIFHQNALQVKQRENDTFLVIKYF